MYAFKVLSIFVVCCTTFIVPSVVAVSSHNANGCNCDVLSIVNAAIAPLQQQILGLNKTIQDLKYILPISCGNHSAYQYYPETGKCYLLHRVTATWPEANSTCLEEDAHLAVIRNREEAQIFGVFAQEKLDTNKLAHIGVYRDSERVWRTVTGETVEAAAGYNPWGGNDPDNKDANMYGAVWIDGTLRNIPNDWYRYYICEKTPL